MAGVGWIAGRRRYRQYRSRIDRLPRNYREAVEALEHYMNHLGGLADSKSILQVLDDLADLFETAAADGTTIRQIVGEDPVEFDDDFVANYPAGGWIRRERERLNQSINRAASGQ